MTLLHQQAEGILYCACLVFVKKTGPEPKEIYFHASDQVSAEHIIKRTYPNRQKVLITAIAPAIGAFAKTEKELETGEGTFKV